MTPAQQTAAHIAQAKITIDAAILELESATGMDVACVKLIIRLEHDGVEHHVRRAGVQIEMEVIRG